MKRNPLKLVYRLLVLVKGMIPALFLAILLGSAGFFAAIAIPVLGGYTALKAVMQEPIRLFLWILILCGVLRGFLRYAEQYLNHYVAFKLLAIIRDHVYRALRRLTPAKLEGRNKGDLISLITSDIELLEVFYAHTITPIAIAFLVSLGMVLFIAQYHIILSFIAVVGYISVGVFLPLIMSKINGSLGLEYRNEFGVLNGYVLENQRGLHEIIQFGAGDFRLGVTRDKSERLNVKARKLKKYENITAAVSGMLIMVFSIAMLIIGYNLQKRGAVGFEGVLLSTIAMLSSFGPVLALANLAGLLTHTFAAGNRVLDILDESPVTEDITDGVDVKFTGADCENITFGYEDEIILENFILNIPQNKIIGITGKSGIGKSTILRLLMRFWDVDKGKINISDKDIKDINTSNLRDSESFVTQDTHLFADTIENNIRIAKSDATMQEIVDACKKASVHDFIETLPNGYKTHLGELGEGLSGGERQRIGLARAFLHDAPFLLLDEPTSNLDSLNEAIILKSLKNECDDKTVILVSHRKSTMGIADAIYNVENGRVS